MSQSFLLSKRAEARGHDLHIFSLSNFPSVCVMAGMNTKSLALTIKNFYRWLDLMDEDERDEEFILKEITLIRVDVLSYCVATIGSSLPRDSSEMIKPGLYGPFYTDGRPFDGKIGDVSPTLSFVDMAVALDSNTPKGSRPSENNLMPDALIDSAVSRDNGVCCITGRADGPTSTIWVFPPMLAMFANDEIDFNKYRTLDNIITIRSELVDAFNQNAFVVDVDDDYRIIQFDSIVGCTLPPRLAIVTASYEFWRENLKWGLTTYLPGTDIRDDFPDAEPARLMQQLYDGKANFDQHVWNSGIGGEVLDQYLLEAEMEVTSSDDDSPLASPICTTNLSSHGSLSGQSISASSEDSELTSPVSISNVPMPYSPIMPPSSTKPNVFAKPIALAIVDRLGNNGIQVDEGNQDVD